MDVLYAEKVHRLEKSTPPPVVTNMSYGQCNRPVKPPVDMEWCQEDTRQSSRQTSSGRFWGQQTNRKHEESFGSTIYSQGISFKWSFFPAPIFFRLSYLKVHINNSKIPYFLVLANSKYGVSMLLVNCLQFQVEWTLEMCLVWHFYLCFGGSLADGDF